MEYMVYHRCERLNLFCSRFKLLTLLRNPGTVSDISPLLHLSHVADRLVPLAHPYQFHLIQIKLKCAPTNQLHFVRFYFTLNRVEQKRLSTQLAVNSIVCEQEVVV